MANSAGKLKTRRAALPDGLESGALLGLYEQMVLLRRFESAAQIACRKGETPGFLHLYIGEEATAVGVCAHLRPTDWITSTHRGHGHALAKGMSPRIADGGAVRQARRLLRRPRRHHASLRPLASACSARTASSAAGISHAVGVGISARTRGTRRHRRRLLRRRRDQPWRLPRSR